MAWLRYCSKLLVCFFSHSMKGKRENTRGINPKSKQHNGQHCGALNDSTPAVITIWDVSKAMPTQARVWRELGEKQISLSKSITSTEVKRSYGKRQREMLKPLSSAKAVILVNETMSQHSNSKACSLLVESILKQIHRCERSSGNTPHFLFRDCTHDQGKHIPKLGALSAQSKKWCIWAWISIAWNMISNFISNA